MFRRRGCDLDRGGRRPVVRTCIDWTERRPHLAGLAGAALHERWLERSWTARSEGSRAIIVTAQGRSGLARLLGLELG